MTKLNLNEAEQSDFLEMSIIKHTSVGFKVPVVNVCQISFLNRHED